MKHGFGVANFANGQKYEGHWAKGTKNGHGVFFFPGGNIYDGEWKDDTKEGYGVAKFSSGNRYEGEWRRDAMFGQGTFFYLNGDIYSGQWSDNKKEGLGTWTSQNGTDRYEGAWENDMRHGVGTLFHGGQSYSVHYEKGQLLACYSLQDGVESPLANVDYTEFVSTSMAANSLAKRQSFYAPEWKSNAPHLPTSCKVSEDGNEHIVICVM